SPALCHSLLMPALPRVHRLPACLTPMPDHHKVHQMPGPVQSPPTPAPSAPSVPACVRACSVCLKKNARVRAFRPPPERVCLADSLTRAGDYALRLSLRRSEARASIRLTSPRPTTGIDTTILPASNTGVSSMRTTA